MTSGSTPPSVIFENGAGRTAADWDVVRSFMDRDVATLAYSRAGQGESDPPAPDDVIFDDGHVQVASAISRTNDLAGLLDAVELPPPYILVGHSLGGIFIRLFAERCPELVAGIVFVDSSHPTQDLRLAEAVRGADIPDEQKEEFLAREPSPNAPIMEQAVTTGPFNGIPLTILSQDPNLPLDNSDSALPVEVQRVWNRTWSELQLELLGLSDDSSHVVVSGADHMVHVVAPQTVAEAIMDIVGRARQVG